MSYTALTSGQTDAESPINDTLMDRIRGNIDYLFDARVRGGTFATPVDLALARGNKTGVTVTGWTQIGSSGVYTGQHGTFTITFSSDAADGDPNFLSAPIVWGTFQSQDIDVTSSNKAIVTPIPYSVSITQAIFTINGWNQASSDITGNLYWLAIGPVAAGE